MDIYIKPENKINLQLHYSYIFKPVVNMILFLLPAFVNHINITLNLFEG